MEERNAFITSVPAMAAESAFEFASMSIQGNFVLAIKHLLTATCCFFVGLCKQFGYVSLLECLDSLST